MLSPRTLAGTPHAHARVVVKPGGRIEDDALAARQAASNLHLIAALESRFHGAGAGATLFHEPHARAVGVAHERSLGHENALGHRRARRRSAALLFEHDLG